MEQEDRNGHKVKQLVYFRFYLNLNTPVSYSGGNGFNIRVQKLHEPGLLVPTYRIMPESFEFLFREFISKLLNARATNDYSEISKYHITEKEVQDNNSKENNKLGRFICLSVIIPKPQSLEANQQQQEEMNKLNELIYTPDEEFSTSLTDFSSLPLKLDLQDPNKKKLSIEEARRKYDTIKEESGLSKEMIQKLSIAFSLDSLLDFNDKNSDIYKQCHNKTEPQRYFLDKIFKMGAALYGPPGTGKTYAIKRTFIYKVIKEIFNINVVEIPASELAEGTKFYGALAETATKIFSKGIKEIQRTQRPCLIFVDEGDRLIENTDRDDDSQGVATIKNYLNPITYPGLMIAINTNITDLGDLNTGLLGRRIDPIEFGYPPQSTNESVWLENIAEQIFYLEKDKKTKKYNKEAIYFYQNGVRIPTDEVIITLAKITAGVIGLDRIDDFCKSYRSITGTRGNDPINDFNKFKIDFFVDVIKRLEHLEAEEISKKAKSWGNNINLQKEEEIKKYYREIRENLENNFKNKSQIEQEEEIASLIKSLNKKNKDNGFYIAMRDLFKDYKKLIESYDKDSSTLNNNSNISLFKKIYANLDFIIEHHKEVTHILHQEAFQEKFFVEIRDIFIKLIVLQKDFSVLIEHIELIGKDSKPLTREEIVFLFSVARRYFLETDFNLLFNLDNENNSNESNSGRSFDDINIIRNKFEKILKLLIKVRNGLESKSSNTTKSQNFFSKFFFRRTFKKVLEDLNYFSLNIEEYDKKYDVNKLSEIEYSNLKNYIIHLQDRIKSGQENTFFSMNPQELIPMFNQIINFLRNRLSANQKTNNDNNTNSSNNNSNNTHSSQSDEDDELKEMLKDKDVIRIIEAKTIDEVFGMRNLKSNMYGAVRFTVNALRMKFHTDTSTFNTSNKKIKKLCERIFAKNEEAWKSFKDGTPFDYTKFNFADLGK